MKPRRPVHLGERFERLLVIAFLGPRFAQCRCDCGAERRVLKAALRGGTTRSCGCLQREIASKNAAARNTTHGESHTRIHGIWSGMISRCSNPRDSRWKNYGGRGIEVCQRWRDSFESFRDDMGPRPSRGHSLDRINNDGHYEPGNVRWATAIQQKQNQRKNVRLVLKGETKTISEWARITGIPEVTIGARIRRGWAPERALTESTSKYHHCRRDNSVAPNVAEALVRANVLDRELQEVG